MTLTAILDATLCVGVIVMVVAPLVWAILTQQRDWPAMRPTAHDAVRASAKTTRRTRRQSYDTVMRPAR